MDQNSRIPDCPRCGNTIDLERWTKTIDMETGAAALEADKTVCLSDNCFACEASLELFIEKSSADDKFGVDVWVENKREN